MLSGNVFSGQFRNVDFGMSKEEVMKAETLEIKFNSETQLMYQDQIYGYKCDIQYQFSDDKLVLCGYVITEEYENGWDLFCVWDDIRAYAIDDYGVECKYREIWLNDKYRDEYTIETIDEQITKVLALGHLKYVNLWEKEGYNIVLVLEKLDSGLSLVLGFTSD